MDAEAYLKRWAGAGLIDADAAGRIRDWEAVQAKTTEGFRWPIIVALVFGALLLAAGVLLFVSAHWDQISPGQRLSLVVMFVAVFHVAGAWAAERFEGLAVALHTAGTFALGAGIGLAGQIYHLSEHWPGAILLWSIGAMVAWVMLRHWTQGALVALLVPFWVGSEWSYFAGSHFEAPVAAGVCALSLTYLSALRTPADGLFVKALAWIGGIFLLPSAFLLAAAQWHVPKDQGDERYLAFAISCIAPLLLAVWMRRRDAIWNAGAMIWVAVLIVFHIHQPGHLILYVWGAMGSMGLISWGVFEQRAERINLGMAGFAITLLAFYFSDVMDKLDRSLSLIILGALFLGGGWLLERTRRRLVAGIRTEAM